jgi:hypothetical protein
MALSRGTTPQFASGGRHFLEFEKNPMMRHDSQRVPSLASIYVRVCLFAIVFAVALTAPSAVAQTTTPQYLFLATNVPSDATNSSLPLQPVNPFAKKSSRRSI